MPTKTLQKLRETYQELQQKEKEIKSKITELETRIQEIKTKATGDRQLAENIVLNTIQNRFYPEFRREVIEKVKLYKKYKKTIEKYSPETDFEIPFISISTFVALVIIFAGSILYDVSEVYLSIFALESLLAIITSFTLIYVDWKKYNKMPYSTPLILFIGLYPLFLPFLSLVLGKAQLSFTIAFTLSFGSIITVIVLLILNWFIAKKVRSIRLKIGYSRWYAYHNLNSSFFNDVIENAKPSKYLIHSICSNLIRAKKIIRTSIFMEEICNDLRGINAGDAKTILRYIDINLLKKLETNEKTLNELKKILEQVLLDKGYARVFVEALELESAGDYYNANIKYNSLERMLKEHEDSIGSVASYVAPSGVGGVENALRALSYAARLNNALALEDPVKISTETEILAEILEDLVRASRHENVYVDLVSEKLREARALLGNVS